MDIALKRTNNNLDVQKMLVVFLIDLSGSMAGSSIESVRAGLKAFRNSLMHDPAVKNGVEIAIHAFGNGQFRILQNFTSFEGFDVEKLRLDCSGCTPMVLGLMESQEEIKKHEIKIAEKSPLKRSILVMLTDGESTESVTDEFNKVYKENIMKNMIVIGAALPGTQVKIFDQINWSESQKKYLINLKKIQLSNTGEAMENFFSFLSRSVGTASSTTGKAKVTTNGQNATEIDTERVANEFNF